MSAGSEFVDELNKNKTFKGLWYICKKRVFSFYFEIDIELNYVFVPISRKLYLIPI